MNLGVFPSNLFRNEVRKIHVGRQYTPHNQRIVHLRNSWQHPKTEQLAGFIASLTICSASAVYSALPSGYAVCGKVSFLSEMPSAGRERISHDASQESRHRFSATLTQTPPLPSCSHKLEIQHQPVKPRPPLKRSSEVGKMEESTPRGAIVEPSHAAPKTSLRGQLDADWGVVKPPQSHSLRFAS